MSTLNLFPARIAFVNPDGTLTAEAYRALTVLFARVGGPLGDNGVDVFGSVFGVANETESLSTLQTDVVQPQSETRLLADLVQQSANFGTDFYGDVVQSPAVDMSFADVIQPSSKDREAGTFTTIDVSGNAVVGGTLRLAAGTVGLPSLYWSTDTTTGFYRIGANNNGYAVGGVKVLDIAAASFGVTGLLDLSATTSGHVKFPATQNPSANVNTLDDYEEGTFTPAFTPATGLFTSITVASSGRYVKVGKTVFYWLEIRTTTATTVGTAAGQLYITGLPFTADANSGGGSVYLMQLLNLASATVSLGAVVEASQSRLYLTKNSSNVSVTYMQVSDLNTGAGSFNNLLAIFGQYQTAN